MLRTVLSPTNCGDIALQYIRAVASSACAARRNTKFHTAHFPNAGRNEVYRLRQFHREIGMSIVFRCLARRC